MITQVIRKAQLSKTSDSPLRKSLIIRGRVLSDQMLVSPYFQMLEFRKMMGIEEEPPIASPNPRKGGESSDDPGAPGGNKATEKPKPAWKVKMAKILDNKYWTIFMAIITIYALFGDDIRLVATGKSADPIFYILTIVCLIFFTIEIVMASLA